MNCNLPLDAASDNMAVEYCMKTVIPQDGCQRTNCNFPFDAVKNNMSVKYRFIPDCSNNSIVTNSLFSDEDSIVTNSSDEDSIELCTSKDATAKYKQVLTVHRQKETFGKLQSTIRSEVSRPDDDDNRDDDDDDNQDEPTDHFNMEKVGGAGYSNYPVVYKGIRKYRRMLAERRQSFKSPK